MTNQESLTKQLSEFKQKYCFSKIAELLTYSLKVNSNAVNRQVFGYIPQLFREIEIKNRSEAIQESDIFLGQPVVYKIFFPSEHKIAEIPFFYLFCYLKENLSQLNVYFQSAARSSKPLMQQDYDLSNQKVAFEGIISAFTERASVICISDPGHFIPGLNSSFYAGTKEINFTCLISNIIESICNIARINLEDTFLFGSSAGGMGALLSSTYFSNKVQVLSVNSQIYTHGLSLIMKTLLETSNSKILLSKFGDRVCCKHRFQQNINSIPNIYLLANVNDDLYQRNYEFYQLYQKLFSGKNRNNQSVFDSYYGVEGHGRPDKASLKRKIRIARETLTMKSNSSSQSHYQQSSNLERMQESVTIVTPKEIAERAKSEFDHGTKLQQQGDLEGAIQSYEKAVALKADYSEPLIALAEFYKSQEKWDKVVKCYQRLISFKPKNPSYHIKLARGLKQQNKIHGAISAFQTAIELKPQLSSKVYKELGDLLLQKKDDAGNAVKVYKQGLENNLNWQPGAGYYLKLADALERKNCFEEAICYFKKAIELKPDYPRCYLSLGKVFFKIGQLDQAISCYKKTLEFDSDCSVAYKKIGDILKQKGQLDLANDYYQKSIIKNHSQ